MVEIVGESKIIDRYKIWIPSAIRELLHVEPNDMVEYLYDGRNLILRKKNPLKSRVFDDGKVVR